MKITADYFSFDDISIDLYSDMLNSTKLLSTDRSVCGKKWKVPYKNSTLSLPIESTNYQHNRHVIHAYTHCTRSSIRHAQRCYHLNKMLSYRRETALQGTCVIVLAKSERLELVDNILRTL